MIAGLGPGNPGGSPAVVNGLPVYGDQTVNSENRGQTGRSQAAMLRRLQFCLAGLFNQTRQSCLPLAFQKLGLRGFIRCRGQHDPRRHSSTEAQFPWENDKEI